MRMQYYQNKAFKDKKKLNGFQWILSTIENDLKNLKLRWNRKAEASVFTQQFLKTLASIPMVNKDFVLYNSSNVPFLAPQKQP